jgi:hypothetical protein
MARGITEAEVHNAADELLASGDRPTVERIRAHLGTGSPNTVTRWLETWWRGLGGRLKLHAAAASAPAAPETVAELVSHVWTQAYSAALGVARSDFDQVRNEMALQRQASTDREQERAEAARKAMLAVDEAQQGRTAAVQRLEDLSRLCEEQRERLAGLANERDSALARLGVAEKALMAAEQQFRERELTMSTERQQQADHMRQSEDKAFAEIDRLRVDLGKAQKQVRVEQGRVQGLAADQHRRDEAARASLAVAHRDAAVARAEADALKAALAERRTAAKASPAKSGGRAGRAPAPERRKKSTVANAKKTAGGRKAT